MNSPEIFKQISQELNLLPLSLQFQVKEYVHQLVEKTQKPKQTRFEKFLSEQYSQGLMHPPIKSTKKMSKLLSNQKRIPADWQSIHSELRNDR
jgi:hypothetical protein